MPIPSHIERLVERFAADPGAFKNTTYNETRTRIDFIDPFFSALGWDINNAGGKPEAYRDVIHEDRITIDGRKKAPDYTFRVGGQRRFFVEAKQPSVNLHTKNEPAFQVRRYGWSAGLPLCILTDFEEFAIYDCRIQPSNKDQASIARLTYYTYADYATKWDEIANLFSYDALQAGSLDAFIASIKPQRGAITVDDAFLRDIESWREVLAKNIAAWNKHLDQRALNTAVQLTLDRIIFLRICEDRDTEPYERLLSITKGGNVYKQLVNIFKDADDRYNSGLFHFANEAGRLTSPDTWTTTLHIDDEPLREIIRRLYYPVSPYAFSVIPVEILGQVYEQFLGKVIHLDPTRTVTVEDKPEVKKAGGVFYTPTYIVNYIVKHTLDPLVLGKTPADLAPAPPSGKGKRATTKPTTSTLTVLDPSCGSGSFLLGAYQYLLDWYHQWYIDNTPAKYPKAIYQSAGGDWRLTAQERKRILINHIYGVDIDAQAVEVTKLSLMLKVLEGETGETINTQLVLLKERALPDLDHNIRCGNSLIASDFYANQAGKGDLEEIYRINAFDWDQEFPQIMQTGGFSAIIGNPPYISVELTQADLTQYYLEHYPFATG